MSVTVAVRVRVKKRLDVMKAVPSISYSDIIGYLVDVLKGENGSDEKVREMLLARIGERGGARSERHPVMERMALSVSVAVGPSLQRRLRSLKGVPSMSYSEFLEVVLDALKERYGSDEKVRVAVFAWIAGHPGDPSVHLQPVRGGVPGGPGGRGG